MQICRRCGNQVKSAMQFCEECGLGISSIQISAASITGLGAEAGVGAVALARSPDTTEPVCCLTPDCPDSVLPRIGGTCPHCGGANLAALSFDAWQRKYNKAQLTGNVMDLAGKHRKKWLKWAKDNMRLMSDDAKRIFDSLVIEVTGVPCDVLKDWYESGIVMAASGPQTTEKADAERASLLKEAVSRKIKADVARRIIEENIPKLEVATPNLHLGPHSPGEIPPAHRLVLRNVMGGILTVTATTHDDWLEIEERPIIMPRGEHILPVNVRMTRLRIGLTEGGIFVESNGGGQMVPVTIRVTRNHLRGLRSDTLL